MSGSHVFVLLILILVFSFALMRTWMSRRREDDVTDRDAEEMLAKIDALEERIRVLERIVTENRVDLKQQIDRL